MSPLAESLPSASVQLHDPARGFARGGPRIVLAQRRARMAGSVALLLGMFTLLLNAARVVQPSALVVLAASWCAAVAVYLVVYVLTLLAPPAMPAPLLARELGRGSASERNALVLPLVAASLLAPLSIHGGVSVLLGCGPGHLTFDDWVVASLIIVGHAHVVLAVLAGRDGARLADGHAISARRTLLWTSVTAGVPGVLLYAIPPALTALTGAVLIPTLYAWARRTLMSERAMLES